MEEVDEFDLVNAFVKGWRSTLPRLPQPKHAHQATDNYFTGGMNGQFAISLKRAS